MAGYGVPNSSSSSPSSEVGTPILGRGTHAFQPPHRLRRSPRRRSSPPPLRYRCIPFRPCSPLICQAEKEVETKDRGKSQADTSRKDSFSGQRLTNVLLAINILVYGAQLATQGKLMLWGAKINSLIDRGQLWRLVSSPFLHGNIGHLMVNCYSLNSIGPTVEKISGPRRYMAVYFTSAIASAAMSYWFCKAPAVGASGAIFGLVGAYAMFILRHRNPNNDGTGELQHIAQVIVLNMGIGLMWKGIDNWGHLGGLIGGLATSWFVDPAWKYESDGNRTFVDKAPIFSLFQTRRRPC